MGHMHDEYIRTLGWVEARNTTHDCPDCGHPTLSVTKRDGKVLYHCWRATCGIRGVLELVGRDALAQNTEIVPREEEPYRGPITFLSDREEAILGERFRLSMKSISKWVRSNGARYILPIYTREKWLRGYVVREPWAGTELPATKLFSPDPKSQIFGGCGSGRPVQSWYRPNSRSDENDIYVSDTVVLVEDQISAMRVTQDLQLDSVALLGVSLNAEKVADIQADKRGVVIALDADATRTAFEHARVWGQAFQSCRVVILTKDIKDMTLEEIRALPI